MKRGEETDHDDRSEYDELPDIEESRSSTPDCIFNFNFLTINARSIKPKITSLVDYFHELNICACTVSETWLKDGVDLEKFKIDLEGKHRLKILLRNRPETASGRRMVGGGVSVIFDP